MEYILSNLKVSRDVIDRINRLITDDRDFSFFKESALLDRLIDAANGIKNPIEASFYLFSGIPYLQPFRNGNKRVSRAICNIPPLQAELPTISFAGFNKHDYDVAVRSVCESGDATDAEQLFANAYLKSIKRFNYDKNKQSKPYER